MRKERITQKRCFKVKNDKMVFIKSKNALKKVAHEGRSIRLDEHGFHKNQNFFSYKRNHINGKS